MLSLSKFTFRGLTKKKYTHTQKETTQKETIAFKCICMEFCKALENKFSLVDQSHSDCLMGHSLQRYGLLWAVSWELLVSIPLLRTLP